MKEVKRYVLVTTEYRGVFAGEFVKEEGRTVTLRNARCAIYWGTKRGFLQLGDTGPTSSSRIGSVALEIVLHGVTSISVCTPAAEAAWEKA